VTDEDRAGRKLLELSLEYGPPVSEARIVLARHPRVTNLVTLPELAAKASDELVVPFVVSAFATALNE
jgi:hypothetical protein